MLPNPTLDEPADKQSPKGRKAKVGRGRNGASRFAGAKRITVADATLGAGDTSPERQKGKVYGQKNLETLIRITGRPPLELTAY